MEKAEGIGCVPVKVAIIADDLTGANDTGVQFSRKGLSTTVLLDLEIQISSKQDVVAFDTDSRSISKQEAVERVDRVCEYMKQQEVLPEIIYKKIDSTLRGNIGGEWDAIYRAFQPDFIVIAPSYPKMGRVMKSGSMFVNGSLLHETAASKDPKNPSTSSYLPELLKEQSEKPFALLTTELLRGDRARLTERIKQLYEAGIPYLLFDAETDEDLANIAGLFRGGDYHVIWSGSAGLAYALTTQVSAMESNKAQPSTDSDLVMVVVGSVHAASRRQLDYLLQQENVIGIELNSLLALTEEGRMTEYERVSYLALQAVLDKQHVVLYSSAGPATILRARRQGREHGMDANQVSNTISDALGKAAARIIKQCGISNLVLTGGDTAKQVCLHLGAGEFELITEIEAGVPVGRLSVHKGINVITKAGGFGGDEVLQRALETFTGGE
jgi:uncharacterized protein YgbK (DUF1537 family)